MKNKRNVLIAFILICALCLSIGYAALTDTLTINGSASAAEKEETPDDTIDTLEEAFDDKLGFTAATVENTTSSNVTVSGYTATYEYVDTVSFDAAGFAMKGDKAVITFTISNAHPDLNAVIAAPTITGDGVTTNNYFTVTTDWGTSAKTVVANNGTTDGTVTVTVTVEMTATPTESQNIAFDVNFTATAQESTT